MLRTMQEIEKSIVAAISTLSYPKLILANKHLPDCDMAENMMKEYRQYLNKQLSELNEAEERYYNSKEALLDRNAAPSIVNVVKLVK